MNSNQQMAAVNGQQPSTNGHLPSTVPDQTPLDAQPQMQSQGQAISAGESSDLTSPDLGGWLD